MFSQTLSSEELRAGNMCKMTPLTTRHEEAAPTPCDDDIPEKLPTDDLDTNKFKSPSRDNEGASRDSDSPRINITTLLSQNFNHDTPKCDCSEEFPTTPQKTEDIDTCEEVMAECCLLHVPGINEKDENMSRKGSMAQIYCANCVSTRRSLIRRVK